MLLAQQLVHVLISIHAPREGSDVHTPAGGPCRAGNFYPRSPRGERLRPVLVLIVGPVHFYPRSPRGERPSSATSMASGSNFYPRSPRGERPATSRVCAGCGADFYPRSPRGERPNMIVNIYAIKDISIHAPREGSDADMWSNPFVLNENFYPRSPRGERQPGQQRGSNLQHFYPRSPRGERRFLLSW